MTFNSVLLEKSILKEYQYVFKYNFLESGLGNASPSKAE